MIQQAIAIGGGGGGDIEVCHPTDSGQGSDSNVVVLLDIESQPLGIFYHYPSAYPPNQGAVVWDSNGNELVNFMAYNYNVYAFDSVVYDASTKRVVVTASPYTTLDYYRDYWYILREA